MDSNLISYLANYGFYDKEAKIYLTMLELGSSIASTIARRAEINRGTTYSILEDFKRRGIVTDMTKEGVKYYSAISPEILFKKQEEKYENIKSQLPEILAVTNKFGSKPKTQFFEGFEGLKRVFEEVLLAGEKMKDPYLNFIGASSMDPRIENYIYNEFIPKRLKLKTKTKSIMAKDTSEYGKYHKKAHNAIVVDKPFFKIWNDIVMYWSNKIAILMYATEEMCGLIIESQTLHDALTSVFNLVRDVYHWSTKKRSKK